MMKSYKSLFHIVMKIKICRHKFFLCVFKFIIYKNNKIIKLKLNKLFKNCAIKTY